MYAILWFIHVCLYILYIVYHIQSQVLSLVSVAMVTLRSAPLI